MNFQASVFCICLLDSPSSMTKLSTSLSSGVFSSAFSKLSSMLLRLTLGGAELSLEEFLLLPLLNNRIGLFFRSSDAG